MSESNDKYKFAKVIQVKFCIFKEYFLADLR